MRRGDGHFIIIGNIFKKKPKPFYLNQNSVFSNLFIRPRKRKAFNIDACDLIASTTSLF